jgi:lipid II:glycine glycyltransferase (peptidoglycan interpeptide bridge formation enzyme)
MSGAAAVGVEGAPVRVAGVADQAPAGWDESTVSGPGGHVLQSAAWAEHRRTQGWRPHFVDFSDGRRALVLTHRQPPLPGFVAYAPRGPIGAGDPVEQVAARAIALAAWLRTQGATILAVDPELDADPAYDTTLAAAGFRETEEIQPSRHRLVLPLPEGADEDAVLAGMAKQARQRIRAAEKAGTRVRPDPATERLDAFGGLLDATARRKGFAFHAESGFVDWWRVAIQAGLADFLVAENEGRLLGGLVLYRQGGHRATAFSADDAALRHDYAGTMHLLRWSAIRMALAEGAPSIDLGGVDLPGLRRKPEPSEPSWGMYEHKRSFGAEWVESAAAHEIELRPLVYRLGLVARSLRRRLRVR